MDINQLIASGKLQPLSLDQRIQPHESPFLDDDVTEIVTGEPMDIAMRLLKLELAPPMTQGVEEQVPMQEDIPMVETMDYNNCDCAEKIKNLAIQNEIRNIRNGKGREDMLEWLISASCEDIQQQQFYEEAARMYCGGLSEADQMKYTGEPMDLAFDAIKKNLNRWFKEKWVDVSRKDKDGKHPPCGRSKASKSSKGYPKCRPSVKVSSKTPKTSGSMSEGQKRAATKRKRSKKQGVGGKPTIVKVE